MSYLYWTDVVNDYVVQDADEQVLDVKRLNFLIGKNNSGKSRFLRGLHIEGKDFCDFSLVGREKLKIFYNSVQFIIESGDLFRFDGKNVDLKEELNCDFLLRNITIDKMKQEMVIFMDKCNSYHFKSDNFRRKISDLFQVDIKGGRVVYGRFYIPVLRGLRPISNDKNSYNLRTQKDYFNNTGGSEAIITGEAIYSFLRSCLLGEPEQRELIQKYEDLLSQYFFEGQKVTLIPKHDSDVVHIKIGDDKQFPIYQLGDGLQQAIILTYQCYLQQDSVCAFFIEEPELHMHAGMLRQLMNFYLNETKHYYFFTTHSNHLLDMVDESDEVVIQKFTKKKKDDGSGGTYFEIKRCDKDRELLAALGVRPSSVYLANCTIWVEGIADRLYLTKYMQRYLYDLEHSDEENKAKFLKYRKFMQNFHYTFVEYQGSNLTHWSFDDDDQEEAPEVERKMKALDVCANMLLIADGDIREKERVDDLQHELGNRFVLLESKEIENTLPASLVFDWAITKFAGAKSKTKEGFDIQKLIEEKDNNAYLQNPNRGIGVLLDDLIREEGTPADKSVFAEKSGTIKKKTDFCTDMLAKMGDRTYWDSVRNPDANDQTLWQLTDEARRLCEQIFEFIDEMNQESFGAASHAP